MVAVPEVGGNMPVRMDLKEAHRDSKKGVSHKSISGNNCHVMRGLYKQHLRDIHGGSLPSPIVSQKGSNLALIKADAKAIHSWSEAAAENLDQVLDANTLHQVSRLCLKELLTCIQQRQTLKKKQQQHNSQSITCAYPILPFQKVHW